MHDCICGCECVCKQPTRLLCTTTVRASETAQKQATTSDPSLVAQKQLGNSPETCPGLGNSPERVSEPYFEGVEGFRASDPSLGKKKGFPSLGNSSDTHMKANPFPRLGNKLGSKLGSKLGRKLGRGRGTHMSVPIYMESPNHMGPRRCGPLS